MNVRASIAHAMPGRMRVRLHGRRGDAALFAQLEHKLQESRHYKAVRANPATGSLLLEFAGPVEQVVEQLAQDLPLELELEPEAALAAPALAAAVAPLRLVSGRDLNPMFVIGTLFGAVGLVQALRGQIMIPALSAFWYAAEAYRMAAAPPPAHA